MLKTTPQSLLQFNPLYNFNLLDEDHPPSKWSGDWVSRRWVDGLKTLRLIPMKGAPRGFANAWPPYAYEFEDLIAQSNRKRWSKHSASRTVLICSLHIGK
jgi:hypothetical protein